MTSHLSKWKLTAPGLISGCFLVIDQLLKNFARANNQENFYVIKNTIGWEYFENYGIEVEGINFQRDKDAMLNSLSVAITDHWFRWPVIKGFRQLRQYRRTDDKKLAQDIVMAMAGVAFLCRYLPEEINRATEQARHANYPNRKIRTRVNRKARR